jgi:uncharacterized protein (DUF39 family)
VGELPPLPDDPHHRSATAGGARIYLAGGDAAVIALTKISAARLGVRSGRA